MFDKNAAAVLRALPPAAAVRKVSIVATREWPDYVFSYLPIAGILLIMAVYHPGLYLPRRLLGVRLRAKALMQKDGEKKTRSCEREEETEARSGSSVKGREGI